MRQLMDLADIIKVDFLTTSPEERFALTYKIDLDRVKLLAEKVETIEDYEQAIDLGYSYFQGYFFSKPAVLSRRNVPAYKMNYLQILREINRLDLDYDRLERIFKQDVTLSYKLMTYINSAYFGFPNKIRSIRYALALIGLREAKKWLSLIALSSMGQDKSQELVVSSLFRANLCELLAPIVGLDNYSSDLFLVGLFSLIDAFLDQPMPDILRSMPLTDEIKFTLLGQSTPFVPVYNLVLSYEKGDWDTTFRCLNAFDTEGIDLPALFVQTIERSNKIIPV
jgi:EAL and modified HD-GYP domain-containing signal transduction protein